MILRIFFFLLLFSGACVLEGQVKISENILADNSAPIKPALSSILPVSNFSVGSYADLNDLFQEGTFNISITLPHGKFYFATMNFFELEWQKTNTDPLLDMELDPLSDIHSIPDGRDFLKMGLILRL